MTQTDFEKIVEGQLSRTRAMLFIKGAEYSLNGDRLDVFKKAAALQGETPKQALCGMLSKHTVSIYDMCMSDDKFDLARWNEKITDHINYLLLLLAAVHEEIEDETT